MQCSETVDKTLQGNPPKPRTLEVICSIVDKELDAMQTITDIRDLLAAVDVVSRKFPTEAWWRGQPATSMDVCPSVFRNDLFGDGWTAQKERDLAIRFLMGASTRHTGWIANDDAHSLAVMRHYGLATRLLDWTRSPLFALYFAVQEDRDDADLWVLCPERLNRVEFDRCMILSPYQDDEVKALFGVPFRDLPNAPRKVAAVALREVDIRMSVQLAAFTVHGDPTPLNRRSDSDHFMCRFQIPKSAQSALKEQLFVLGIRKSNLFPDLDHLAEELNDDARTEIVRKLSRK